MVQMNTVTQILEPRSFLEIAWLLGLLLMSFGFYDLLKNPKELKANTWLGSINSIQTQSALWGFLFCIAFLVAFWLVSYIFAENQSFRINLFRNLPSMLIIFSLLSVLVSSVFAKAFSLPFRRIEAVINSYMLEKDKGIIQGKSGGNIDEFVHLEGFLTKAFVVLDERNRAREDLYGCAAQVSHDIRSPLSALNTALRNLPELNESQRVLIRNAVRRIGDIANNLLWQYKTTKTGSSPSEFLETVNSEQISGLLDSLVSEKRIQMEASVVLIFDVSSDAQGCFVKLNANEFKRMMSNLINNAEEAIESKGYVRVTLNKVADDLVIKIIDNGVGIPEDVLPKIKQGGISVGKIEGFGLGISGAIQSIKKWNGKYDIQSKVGEGTTFTIEFPITENPSWFQAGINFLPNAHVVVLDDDESIHNIWEMHFQSNLKDGQVTLEHFYNPSAFIEYCKTLTSEKDLFLIDYELIGFEETGLDLIERFNLKDKAILVTSRHEEPNIRARAEKLGIKIIPKNFAPYINVLMKKPFEQPDLILIDDSQSLTQAWELCASLKNKKIATFNRSGDFKKVMSFYNKDIPIYIDSDLKEKVPGEQFAKFLYDQGFHVLYLATGYESDRFGDLPWIKKIVSKGVPF
jgi:signal transduction histidine kinase